MPPEGHAIREIIFFLELISRAEWESFRRETVLALGFVVSLAGAQFKGIQGN